MVGVPLIGRRVPPGFSGKPGNGHGNHRQHSVSPYPRRWSAGKPRESLESWWFFYFFLAVDSMGSTETGPLVRAWQMEGPIVLPRRPTGSPNLWAGGTWFSLSSSSFLHVEYKLTIIYSKARAMSFSGDAANHRLLSRGKTYIFLGKKSDNADREFFFFFFFRGGIAWVKISSSLNIIN